MAHTAHIPVEPHRVEHHPQTGTVSAISVANPANENRQPYEAYYFGMPANESGQLQGIDLAIYQAVSKNPTFQNIRKETVCNVEIMNAVSQALRDIFHGNGPMHALADEIQATVHALSLKVEEYKQLSATNPTVSIAYLKEQIGPGSVFVQSHKAHHMRHHPKHPSRAGAGYLAANSSLFGEREYDGTVHVKSIHDHYFGQAPSN